MPAVKVSDLFREVADWYDFYATFHDYKLFGDLPDIFGRDEALDLKDIHHIHLAKTVRIKTIWSKQPDQFRRTIPLKEPENDYWLIYAYDDFKNEYLLLTVIGPKAHQRAEWDAYLRTVLVEIVEPWILGRIDYPEID